MLGSEGVVRGLHANLEVNVPRRMAGLRERFDADLATLPDIRRIYADEVEALSIEKFPALVITVPDTDGKLTNRQTDLDSTFEEYSYRYNIRLFAYVIGADSMATSRLIKRTTLGVREALLTKKILPVGDDDRAEIDPQTIKESYSEVEKGQRGYLAASYVEFQVVTHEVLTVLDIPEDLVEIETVVTPAAANEAFPPVEPAPPVTPAPPVEPAPAAPGLPGGMHPYFLE